MQFYLTRSISKNVHVVYWLFKIFHQMTSNLYHFMLMVRNGRRYYLKLIDWMCLWEMSLIILQNSEHRVPNTMSFTTYACISGKKINTNSCFCLKWHEYLSYPSISISNPPMERRYIQDFTMNLSVSNAEILKWQVVVYFSAVPLRFGIWSYFKLPKLG